MFRLFLRPIFANGSEGYTCFRIPAIVRTPSGTLLVLRKARRNGCGDFGNVRLVMRVSRNNGKTWSALHDVAVNGDLQGGNPPPIVDTFDHMYPRRRVFFVYAIGDAPESAVRDGRAAAPRLVSHQRR